jgi:hypothetical protein
MQVGTPERRKGKLSRLMLTSYLLYSLVFVLDILDSLCIYLHAVKFQAMLFIILSFRRYSTLNEIHVQKCVRLYSGTELKTKLSAHAMLEEQIKVTPTCHFFAAM